MKVTRTVNFHGKTITFEVGHMAKQAQGSAYIRCGETTLLSTVCASATPKVGIDFLPLSVEYFERFSAAGKIPGGFFKREGRPTEKEILTSRLCDRPIRPLFPDSWANETQIVSTVFSFDKENDSDVLAVTGASLALHVSEIPFMGPIAAVRVVRVDGKLICNPTFAQTELADLEMIVASSKNAIMMVEGGAKQVPESDVLEALMFAFESAQPLIAVQEEIRTALGLSPKNIQEAPADHALRDKVRTSATAQLAEVLKIKEKTPRYAQMRQVKESVLAAMVAKDPALEEQVSDLKTEFEEVVREAIRNQIVQRSRRIDARSSADVRAISIEVGLLPRAHGSTLFTRGETQAMVTTTLGTTDDEQMIDAIGGESKRKFMLHYNFPSFSVGETKPMRGPGRREIGHGALAYRSIQGVLPDAKDFPYSLRVVSDILESHGSSSMATVCGATLSLMDAGVPIKAPVAGIAMGLIKEGEKFIILSDISGDEDHIGDMDFKVAGTSIGVTAIQMDIKVRGINRAILEQALNQAKEGRLHILGKMNEVLSAPRTEISKYAPRMEIIKIPVDKIRELIGPGGKMIRSIVEETKAKIEVDDSGKVTIFSADLEALKKAKARVEEIGAVPEVGKIYTGMIRKVMDYGAFVQIIPGTDGLLHVTEIHSTTGRINDVSEVLKEGETIEVKVLAIDSQGKIKLSNKEVVAPGSSNYKNEPQGERDRPPRREDSGRPRPSGGRDRGPSRGRF